MAAPEETDERREESTGAAEPCSPCRGSGKVISNLGGKPEEITCPWCDGGGTRLPAEHDAQARFKSEQAPTPPDAPPAPEAA